MIEKPRLRRLPVSLCVVVVAVGGCGVLDSVPRGAETITAGFRGPTPQEAAELALDPYNADSRFRGIQLLSNADFGGNDPYVRLYLDGVDDEDPGVRWVSIRALGRHGDPEHVPLIINGLSDMDPQVRAESARALQRLHADAAVDALIRATDPELEPDPAVRAEAAHALGQYAQSRVVQALVASLDDPSLAVNRNTRQALRTLTGQDFKFDRGAWVAWIDGADDLFAARTPYTYPVFERDKRLVEWLPFMGEPPNEAESTPVGMMPPGSE